MRNVSQNPVRSENQNDATAKPTQFSVLLAEDLRDLQNLMAMWLEEAGHRVTQVSSGREVVAQVTARDFDLLVTDILMPDGDGWEAIAEVRRVRPEMRIIAISGGASEMPANATLRAARVAGAMASLKKPVSRPNFLETVARVMATKPRE